MNRTDRFVLNLVVSAVCAGMVELAMYGLLPGELSPIGTIPLWCMAAMAVVLDGMLILLAPCVVRSWINRSTWIFRNPPSEQAAWSGRLLGWGLGLVVGAVAWIKWF
ncbi:hypothetical protein WS62_00940 [Burkholderia sp. ABCPW 14]|uniref:hypothetical protein n=1 Tax=Burkholderia sp. ABCPW 14 TaxID=1637860 RepID=UPI000770CE0A|nr:hypothetical protein [Burkholderia sp. ABCPW 14]KVD73535.1 hypothetical protein WS62_00940 [Burkholderia sp. ABCPW 14]